MLSAEEIKRRIHAARILRNIKQADLQRSLAADGLGKVELGRIERGDLPLTKIRREVLATALRVPERWFLEESIDLVVGFSRPLAATVPPRPPGELGRELRGDPPRAPDQGQTESLEEEEIQQEGGG